MADHDDNSQNELFSFTLTTLQEFAAAQAEMFTALVGQGFTEDQALNFCAKYSVELWKGTSE